MISNAPPGLARVVQEVAQNPAAASATVVERVAKREVPIKECHLRGADAAAKARAKRATKVLQSSSRPRCEQDEELAPARKPGVMLVRFQDEEARLKAHHMQFQLTSDPLDFVAQVVKDSAAKEKGHVVLSPLENTDYALSAMLAAATMGAFHATPEDFVKDDDKARGLLYTENYKSPKQSFHLAVTQQLARESPTLPQLLRKIAQSPGSRFTFYLSEKKLHRFFRSTVKATPNAKAVKTTFVLAVKIEIGAVKKAPRGRYIPLRAFLLEFSSSERAVPKRTKKLRTH